MDAGEKVSGEFIVARGDGTEMLEFVEEALDEVALAVEREVAVALGRAVGLGRDHRGDAARGEIFDQRVGVESLVGEEGLRIGVLEQRRSGGEIVRLTRRQHQGIGIAEGIDERMDFGGQSAARPADGLVFAPFFRAPALC